MVDVKEQTAETSTIAIRDQDDDSRYQEFVTKVEVDGLKRDRERIKTNEKEISEIQANIARMKAQIKLLSGKVTEVDKEVIRTRDERDTAIGEKFMLLLKRKDAEEDAESPKLKRKKSSDGKRSLASGKTAVVPGNSVVTRMNSASWKLNSPREGVFNFNNPGNVFGSTRSHRQGYDLNQSMTAEEQLNANYIDTLRLTNKKIEEKTIGFKFAYAQIKAANENQKDDLEEAIKTYQGLLISISEEDQVIQHVRKCLAEVVPDVKTLETIAKKTRVDVVSKTKISAFGRGDALSPRNANNITVDNIQVKDVKLSPLSKISNFIGRFRSKAGLSRLRSQQSTEL